MRIPVFAVPYKVRPALGTEPWRGWRVWWLGVDMLHPCEFVALVEGMRAKGETVDAPLHDKETDEYFWYPLCPPDNMKCRCCSTYRERGTHSHSGFVRGNFPIGRSRWRKHWWSR